MKKLLTLPLIFILGNCFSQYLPVTPTAYGSNNLRGKFKTVLLLPVGCGAPGFMSSYSVDSTSSSIFTDSCNNKAYIYNPSTHSWSILISSTTGSSGNADSLQHIVGTNYIQYGGTGITTGSTSYSVPAGTMIDKIIFYDHDTQSVSIGSAVNLRDISPIFYVRAGKYSTIILNYYYASSTTIYFNGVSSNTIIKIYKQ